MTYRDTILQDTPLAYWRLGEAVSITVGEDETANNYDVTYTAGASALLAQAGLLFNDANTALAINALTTTYAARSSFALSGANATVEFLMNGSGAAFSLGSTATPYEFGFRTSGNTILWSVRGTNTTTGAYVLMGMTNHIIMTWRNSDGRVQIWVNGILAYSTTGIGTATTITSGGTFFIGQRQNTNGGTLDAPFSGTLDEVSVYNSVLSDARIQDHYNAAVGDQNGPGLIATAFGSSAGVRLIFSEPIANILAANISFAPPLSIASISRTADETGVDVLFTTPAVPGTSYVVTVASPPVTDARNNNLVANVLTFTLQGESSNPDVAALSDGLQTPSPVTFPSGLLDIEVFGFANIIPFGPRTIEFNQNLDMSAASWEHIEELLFRPKQYVMRAYRALSPGYIFWTVIDEPDFIGDRSPYPPVQLADIVIEQEIC